VDAGASDTQEDERGGPADRLDAVADVLSGVRTSDAGAPAAGKPDAGVPAGGTHLVEDSALTAEDREDYIAVEANAWCLALEISVQRRMPMSDAILAEGRRRARSMMFVDGAEYMLAAGAYRSSVVVRAEIRRRAKAKRRFFRA
jgi:hypothetical protein